jgi:DeoR/GlpR family transcriptional regulator of sugar metabolism
MLAIERQQRILELLRSQGSLRTTEAAEAFGVTDETIRKDFEQLEKQGEVMRIHGGVSRPLQVKSDLTFHERQSIQRDAKRAIAKLAASRIQAQETIFLDASSTALTLTEFLPDLPLTILTNALNVLTALSDRPNLELMSTGGLFDPRSRSFIGLTAEKSLQLPPGRLQGTRHRLRRGSRVSRRPHQTGHQGIVLLCRNPAHRLPRHRSRGRPHISRIHPRPRHGGDLG